jgi:DNA-binding MarR family transcriptional regulator
MGSTTPSFKRSAPDAKPTWTFLSNHGHVLIYLSEHQDALLREVADAVGITERSVQMIVADLEAAGALERTRVGRRNRYRVSGEIALRHPIESHCTVADLLAMIRRAR